MPEVPKDNINKESSLVQLLTQSKDPEKTLEKQMKEREKEQAYSINRFLDYDEQPKFKDISKASAEGKAHNENGNVKTDRNEP